MIPLVHYDVDGDGTKKLVTDILRRVKARTETILDGAVFYNYQMQDSDNAEIIADKYYGSSQYHWVVLLMNSIHNHTYDFALNDANFEKYINSKYGSFARAYGVTKTLSSSASIGPQWHAYEQHGDTGLGANSQLIGVSTSGTIPAGRSTAIVVHDELGADPFSSIYVGDVIHIFVPESWYDKSTTSTHTGTLEADSTLHREIELQATTASSLTVSGPGARANNGVYVGGVITITGEGTGTTGITGNTRTIELYDGSTKKATVGDDFEDLPQGGEDADAWTYSISYPTPANYPKLSYVTPSTVTGKAALRTAQYVDGVWQADTQDDTRLFMLSTDLNSNTFSEFSWDKLEPDPETIVLKTGIHHFELNIADNTDGVIIANTVYISQDVYANSSIGSVITNSTKKIVFNYEYEEKVNEEKRTIYLLKKEYLFEFVAEFESLMKNII